MNRDHLRGAFYTILCMFAGIGIIASLQMLGATRLQIVALSPVEFSTSIVPADGSEPVQLTGPLTPIPGKRGK